MALFYIIDQCSIRPPRQTGRALRLVSALLLAFDFVPAAGVSLTTSTDGSRTSSPRLRHTPETDSKALLISQALGKPKVDGGIRVLPFQPTKEEPMPTGKPVERCNDLDQVHSGSQKSRACPASCPLYVERAGNRAFCDFECVEATDAACMAANPRTPVSDARLGVCRTCMIDGCSTCMTDGSDRCAECKLGYRLSGGYCYNKYRFAWLFALLVLALLFALVVLYVVQLSLRRVTNPKGLHDGLQARSRAKLRQPKDSSSSRELWPVWTNLLRQDVAGPGMLLSFNFQFVIIIWALGVALAWNFLADAVDPELLLLGTYRASGGRDNCIIVAHGYETQRSLLWAKESFCYGLYVVSFFLALAHAVRQLRLFQQMDEEATTHKDYACLLEGLPQLPGTERVEEELKEAIADVVKVPVVGVSVSWNFVENEDAILEALDDIQDAVGAGITPKPTPRDSVSTPQPTPREAPRSSRSTWSESGTFGEKVVFLWEAFKHKFDQTMQIVEKTFLSPTSQKIMKRKVRKPKHERIADADGEDVDAIEDVLKSMTTCTYAFVVFESEQGRDEACAACGRAGGISFRDATLQLSRADAEPATVLWKNCAYFRVMDKVKSVIFGILTILLALAVWGGCFYLPYAYFVMSFNYAHGQEPSAVASLAFSMLVVGGNAVMYFVCSEVADRVAFKYEGHREVCYMLLYAFACTLNVLLDLATAYFVAYQMMVGQDFRTYDGTPLAEVPTFTERFETYAMQRALGDNLMEYAFPSTFLIPFLLEPIIAIVVPYTLMRFIVRSHPEITGSLAESYLQCTPIDLSRYADLHLNLMLAVLVFYFPPGFVVKMFVGLGLSHVWIYAYDHYRLLRSVPTCDFASMDVDWWATWMFCVPVGLLLATAIFKGNCQDGHHCASGLMLVAKCSAAFVLHVILHTSLLVYVVPKLGKAELTPVADSYKECAKRLPYSWFNQNPVFCLRSYFIYEHDPPCLFARAGKEHYLRVNEKIGCYFEDEAPEAEEFDPSKQLRQMMLESQETMQSLKRSTTETFEEMKKSTADRLHEVKAKTATLWGGSGSASQSELPA